MPHRLPDQSDGVAEPCAVTSHQALKFKMRCPIERVPENVASEAPGSILKREVISNCVQHSDAPTNTLE
jgi:hypothetical protein